MDINRLTQKTQEAIQAAQSLAVKLGHQEVDGEHLLLALLDQPEGLVPRLLQKMEVSISDLAAQVRGELQGRPSLTGGGLEAGKVYITPRLQQLLVSAEDETKRLKDEYVSVEHLMLAILGEGESSSTGRILADLQVDRDRFLAALREVRGSQRVTSASPEQAYEALEKYGIDLVEQARSGGSDR
jgi:ATP-dependent Clp protease ATP-binding subunit ClpB